MSKKMLDWIDRFDLEEVYGIDYETCLTMYDVAREGMVPLDEVIEIVESVKHMEDCFKIMIYAELYKKYGVEG